MKQILSALISSLLLGSMNVNAQAIKLNKAKLAPNLVSISFERIRGKDALRVIKDSTMQQVDEPTFVRISDIDFMNGTIEVKVLSRLLKNAPETARGFVGVAFRINEINSSFESIYIRPTNGRADDQVRRNHAIQYFSYPDYKFDRLRKETPERYESYADMTLNEWITMRIVVNGQEAELYLNDTKQPALLVKDLKHGEGVATAGRSGGIGLWVDVGTEGYFADLKVNSQ
ncbi:hypothetical protein [Spirosoma endophyticum]|uniref:3-keto-disaccharide hydrolase domain-containing protein n=1 Tax=Spirosoma endophyticum TaxID=662367 RepID=A0A1I2DRW7_9BACT|nr:hypothetical protein [Spirosoma endophyticum]SFE83382.1 hypothetical protein SAMN05216167_12046 [Spirosoma endophyticum]